MRPGQGTASLTTVVVLLFAGTAVAGPADPSELAARIDARAEAHWKADKIKPAPLAADAEFMRRACLDITGRIPRIAEVHEFLGDRSTDKRVKLIEKLLDDPRFSLHFANILRAELAPEISSVPEAAAFQAGFEAWLRPRLRAGAGYDKLVRELLMVPIPAEGTDSVPVLRDPRKPNPLAFYAVKDARPENLAAAVTRSLLGIRLECAQCHDHPFAKWKQGQFWGQAAFFAGLQRKGKGMFAPLSEVVDRHELAPPSGRGVLQAEFLDGSQPKWPTGIAPRAVLAEWITAPDNPYFARAMVNRLWGQFFGAGLVDPVDDFRDDNPPCDPELLDDLARSFVKADFDLRWVIQAICMTRLYQRTSVRDDPRQDEGGMPARMRVKPLTGEQFFDNFALATGYRDDQDKGAARRQFLTRFASTDLAAEPETSVQQALTMRNGPFVAWATDPDACPTLIAVTQTPGMTLAQRIEALYLATLSRKPTEAELARTQRFVSKAERDQEAQRLGDVFWMLLNTAEFRSNH